MENIKAFIQRFWKIGIFAGVTLLLIFSGLVIQRQNRYQDYLQSLKASGFNKYLDMSPVYSKKVETPLWDIYQFSAPEYECVMGGDFGLMVHRGKQNDKTVLWLQPGQECWPGHPNCSSPDGRVSLEQAFEKVLSSANGSPFGPGQPDADNPLADWNYIYVPSCDGSFHFGDAAADYDDDGMIDHRHNGLRQTSAAVNMMKTLFPDSKKILVADSSTGGFGTFGAIPLARLAFPNAGIYVLNDSGPGVFNSKSPALWPLIIQTWNLEPMFPADCPDCRLQLTYFYDWLLARDPQLKIGMFSSYQDAVVGSVVGLSATENETAVLAASGKVHEAHPDTFKRFFIKGASHCIPDYY